MSDGENVKKKRKEKKKGFLKYGNCGYKYQISKFRERK